MIIQWSDEDQLFLVTITEFADLVVYHTKYDGQENEPQRHEVHEVRRKEEKLKI
jgi:hypothetical protein